MNCIRLSTRPAFRSNTPGSWNSLSGNLDLLAAHNDHVPAGVHPHQARLQTWQPAFPRFARGGGARHGSA
jgi:hypothetical protein